jgi:hypothetical protein
VTVGFFCTGLAVLAACTGLSRKYPVIYGTHPPQCPLALEVSERGRVLGAYVDDSLGSAETLVAQQCTNARLTVFAGQWGPAGVPGGMREWYPVADHRSAVGPAPPPGDGGYILQSFSWGDNLDDGRYGPFHRCNAQDTTATCAARYQAPSRAQLRSLWCHALARRPRSIFWYYAGDEIAPLLATITQRTSAGRRRPSSGCGPPLEPDRSGLAA